MVHDCAIQKLPVRFILDRAGLVGNDGPTHHGAYDLAYLGCIPDMIICAPSDEVELMNMVQTVYEIDNYPSALRYPRGVGLGLEKLNDYFGYDLDEIPASGKAVPVGKGRVICDASAGAKQRVAILSIGTRLAPSIEAARAVEAATNGEVGVTVADARFMKPLDTELILQLAADHEVLITVEEGSIGGFGDHVLHFLALSGELDDGKLKVRPMVLPDKYFEAGSQNEQYEEAGLTAPFIEATMLKLTGRGSGQVQKAEKVDEEGTIA